MFALAFQSGEGLLDRTIVAIDVGTTKICTLIGQMGNENTLRVTGVGVVPSRGLRKGVITDVEAASKAIGESVQKAERVAGVTVSEAYVGVGGSHIASQNSPGVVAIGKGDRPVDRDDIERAMEAAEAVAVPHNRRIVHVIPREFHIDGQDGIKNPLGLMGFRLEVEAFIATGAAAALQNLIHCVELNRIAVKDLVVEPLASAEAVLTEEERNQGVAVVDIGGGTTSVAIFVDGSIWQTLVQGVGGNQISNDIAVGLRMPFAAAEEVKIRYAHAVPSAVDERETIEINVFGDDPVHTISRRQLCDIVAVRVQEMFEWVSREIKRSGFDGLLSAGIVLTGGSSNLMGIREVMAKELQLPVRVATPRRLQGLVETISSPAYAASVGLLLWGARAELSAVDGRPRPVGSEGAYQKLLKWLRILLPW